MYLWINSIISWPKYSGSDWTLQLHVTNVILSITTTCHWGDIEHYNYMSRTRFWAFPLHITHVILSISTACHARDIEHYNCMSRTWYWACRLHVTHAILSDSLSWICVVLAHWNNSTKIDMSPQTDTLSWIRADESLLFLLNAAYLSKKQQIPIL